VHDLDDAASQLGLVADRDVVLAENALHERRLECEPGALGATKDCVVEAGGIVALDLVFVQGVDDERAVDVGVGEDQGRDRVGRGPAETRGDAVERVREPLLADLLPRVARLPLVLPADRLQRVGHRGIDVDPRLADDEAAVALVDFESALDRLETAEGMQRARGGRRDVAGERPFDVRPLGVRARDILSALRLVCGAVLPRWHTHSPSG
jgi:hypothetical protein